MVVAALCLSAACSKSPSAPSTPPPSGAPPPLTQYAGFWSGSFRLSTCAGDRHCVLAPPSAGGPTLMRVTEWVATLDEFGRMKGSFKYEFAYPSSAPRLGELASIELWQVIKRP